MYWNPVYLLEVNPLSDAVAYIPLFAGSPQEVATIDGAVTAANLKALPLF